MNGEGLAERLVTCERELDKTKFELRRTELQLVQREKLSDAGQNTASLVHKLGTPLNLIAGYVQLLLGRTGDEDELHVKLRQIQHQVERLTRIMRSMLDETREPVVDLRPLSIGELVERMLAAWEPKLESRAVRLEKELAAGLPPVLGDESQLEQVFMNLMDNGLEAMPAGGILSVSARAQEDKVEVRISDTGEGIPSSDLVRIFRPLYTTKEIGRGTGLGLAIVKEILSAHDAGIRVESRLGEGTTFTLELPCARKDEPARAETDDRVVPFRRRLA